MIELAKKSVKVKHGGFIYRESNRGVAEMVKLRTSFKINHQNLFCVWGKDVKGNPRLSA